MGKMYTYYYSYLGLEYNCWLVSNDGLSIKKNHVRVVVRHLVMRKLRRPLLV